MCVCVCVCVCVCGGMIVLFVLKYLPLLLLKKISCGCNIGLNENNGFASSLCLFRTPRHVNFSLDFNSKDISCKRTGLYPYFCILCRVVCHLFCLPCAVDALRSYAKCHFLPSATTCYQSKPVV